MMNDELDKNMNKLLELVETSGCFDVVKSNRWGWFVIQKGYIETQNGDLQEDYIIYKIKSRKKMIDSIVMILAEEYMAKHCINCIDEHDVEGIYAQFQNKFSELCIEKKDFYTSAELLFCEKVRNKLQ